MTIEQDADLVTRIAAGDVEAFGDLYDRHAARMYALCYRLLRSTADSEEVLQDGFLQVWRQASRFDASRGPVAAWLVMMMRSRALDRLRAARATSGACRPEVVEQDPDLSSEAGVLEREQASRVREQVVLLPAAQRVPLELAFYEGLTHAEISILLCQPLGTVKTRIRHALSRMRDGLDADGAPVIAREPSPFTVALSRYLAIRAPDAAERLPLRGLRVMVIDDDDDTLHLLQTVLQSAGAEVILGASGATAVAQLNGSWPDVMVTDIRMPGEDGYSLADRITALALRRHRTLPIVAFTACRRMASVHGRVSHFAAHLPKPSPPRLVIETVARLCGRNQAVA